MKAIFQILKNLYTWTYSKLIIDGMGTYENTVVSSGFENWFFQSWNFSYISSVKTYYY